MAEVKHSGNVKVLDDGTVRITFGGVGVEFDSKSILAEEFARTLQEIEDETAADNVGPKWTPPASAF